ncbi:MAG: glycosyltransferase family 39 protein [Actinobacteria bacterium]|nr:glycosyltransferase family 39 protein [Actinomycetota bacterium]
MVKMLKKLGGWISGNRKLVLIAAAVLLAGLLLRVFNTGHVLTYDEAWNSNTMVSVAEGASNDIFFNNYYRHPPLYNTIGIIVEFVGGVDRQSLAIIMEVTSILISLVLMLVIFLCGKEWFGATAGFFASVLYALLPAARVYDSFIKPESLTLLFAMLFLYFFFRRRYLIGGLLLGLAALSKEIFIFIPLALAVYLLVTWKKERFKGCLLSMATAAAISSWWYLFMSNSRGEFIDFFLGRSQESLNWGRSWSYYISRIPSDLGWIMLAIVIFACVLLVYKLAASGEKGRLSDDSPLSMSLFCVIWFLLTYLVISVSYGKPPWMVYSALPAAALLGGWALQELLKLFEGRQGLGYAVVAVLLALVLGLSLTTGFGSFMKAADPTFAGAENHKLVAEYVNKNSGDDATLMFRVNDFSPNLAFYLDLYQPDGVFELPAAVAESGKLPERGEYPIILVRRDSSAGDVLNWIESYSPTCIVLRPGFSTPDGVDIADILREYSKPVEIGNIWIFSGKGVTGKIEEGFL